MSTPLDVHQQDAVSPCGVPFQRVEVVASSGSLELSVHDEDSDRNV